MPYQATFEYVETLADIPTDPPKGRLYFVNETSGIVGDLGDGITGWGEHVIVDLNLLYSAEYSANLIEGTG